MSMNVNVFYHMCNAVEIEKKRKIVSRPDFENLSKIIDDIKNEINTFYSYNSNVGNIVTIEMSKCEAFAKALDESGIKICTKLSNKEALFSTEDEKIEYFKEYEY